MGFKSNNPAQKRYRARFGVAMTAYVVAIVAVSLSFKHLHPTGPLAYALAVLPSLPIIAVIAVIGLYIAEEKDEFVRNTLVESMLWGIGVTCALTSVWGLLEVYMKVPRLWVFMVGPIFCVAYGLANILIRLRYR
jgi:uncharacterized YccA/Bax inhibitor family protein